MTCCWGSACLLTCLILAGALTPVSAVGSAKDSPQELYDRETSRATPGDSQAARQIAYLNCMTFPSVLHNALGVLESLRFIYRRLPCAEYDNPSSLLAMLMAAYCICRSAAGRTIVGFEQRSGVSLSLEQYTCIINQKNPRTGLCMGDVIHLLRLHPVYKWGGGDPFFDRARAWWRHHCEKLNNITDVTRRVQVKRGVLLTALSFLSVRSVRLLAFFEEHLDTLLDSAAALPLIIDKVVLRGPAAVGLKNNTFSAYDLATTEQRLWTFGKIQDHILTPAWRCWDKMDGLLRAACVAEFAGVLKTISLLKGPLLFSHTLEDLLLFDREAQCRVFSFSIETTESLAPFIMPGQNAQVFLSYARAARYRGNVYEGITMDSLAAKVCDYLPIRTDFAGSESYSFPHFTAVDEQQTSCKLVEVSHTLLSGETGGKERVPTAHGATVRPMLIAPEARPIKRLRGKESMSEHPDHED